MRSFTIAISFLLIFLAACFPGASAQTSEQPLETPPTIPDEHESESDPCSTTGVPGESWMDQTHDFVARHLCEPAVWFDGFFGEDRVLDDFRPGTFVKLRNVGRWTEGDGVDYVGDFSIWWRLPQFERLLKRARFFIISGFETDKFTTQPGQPFHPAFDPEAGTGEPAVGVRFDFLTWIRSLVSIDTGIKVDIPLDPFVRMRYQYTKFISENYVVRFTETALWRYTERFTETSQLDLEREINTFTLLRWSNYVTYAEEEAGISWNTGISLITELSPKSAISLDTSMWGVNHPEWDVQSYRVGSRYRLNFYRPWLFFEFEPEVTWPEDVSGHRDPSHAVTAIIEIQFGK